MIGKKAVSIHVHPYGRTISLGRLREDLSIEEVKKKANEQMSEIDFLSEDMHYNDEEVLDHLYLSSFDGNKIDFEVNVLFEIFFDFGGEQIGVRVLDLSASLKT